MFEIKITVDDEKELYNPFDATGFMLNDALQNYLYNSIADRPVGESIRFNIISSVAIDRNRIEAAFANYVGGVKKQLKRDKKISFIQSIRLLLIGSVFVVIGIATADVVNSVFAAIISTIGSFSIWEAANRWLVVMPGIRVKEKMVTVLQNYELEIDVRS